MEVSDESKLEAQEAVVEQPTAKHVAHSDETITWRASEYVHHDKTANWFIVLVAITVVATGVALWQQAWTFAALIVVMAAAVGVYAVRPPHNITYSLGHDGLDIDQKHFGLGEFRAFGVVPDGGLFSIVLIPVKRFMPSITVYFEEKDGEKIVDILGSRLPMQKIEHDFIDRLTRKLHF